MGPSSGTTVGVAESVNVGMAAKGMTADERAAGERETADGADPEVGVVDEDAREGGPPRGALCCAAASCRRMMMGARWRPRDGSRSSNMLATRCNWI